MKGRQKAKCGNPEGNGGGGVDTRGVRCEGGGGSFGSFGNHRVKKIVTHSTNLRRSKYLLPYNTSTIIIVKNDSS